MTECDLWPHRDFTPYNVLGISSDASVAQVRSGFKRMALQTHPDKAPSAPLAQTGRSVVAEGEGYHDSSTCCFTFPQVRAAAEVLLDPVQRARYDQQRSQSMIRDCGTCSDTYSLTQDFDEVVADKGEEQGEGHGAGVARGVRVFQRECRCGGLYEVVLFSNDKKAIMCECDCCSLIVEVVI